MQLKTALLCAMTAALLCVATAGHAASAAPAAVSDAALKARLDRVLARTPLVDGHNDLPWELRLRTRGQLRSIDLAADTGHLAPPAGAAGSA